MRMPVQKWQINEWVVEIMTTRTHKLVNGRYVDKHVALFIRQESGIRKSLFTTQQNKTKQKHNNVDQQKMRYSNRISNIHTAGLSENVSDFL